MERMTTRCYANLIECQDCIEENNCYSHSCDEIEKAIQRLSEYEDLGLSPHEIRTFLGDFGVTVIIRSRKLEKENREMRHYIKQSVEFGCLNDPEEVYKRYI